jgi:hypothetical protein
MWIRCKEYMSLTDCCCAEGTLIFTVCCIQRTSLRVLQSVRNTPVAFLDKRDPLSMQQMCTANWNRHHFSAVLCKTI